MSTDLAVMNIGTDMASVEDLVRNVDVIKQAMKAVMIGPTKDDQNNEIPGIHYGTIPGCGDKHALFQPGAHKLGLLFNLAPEYDITTNDLPNGHREYETVTRLMHRATGRFVGQGVGVCSTMESKYRYRWENTDIEVPKEYWKDRNPELLGGAGYVARKAWGADKKQHWFIFHRVAHDNPADYYNTVKKISKKRAYNDAILTATAASDIFAPDDDTDPELMGGGDDRGGETTSKPPVQQPERASTKAGNGKHATEGQVRLLKAKLGEAAITDKQLCEQFKIDCIENLPMASVNDALDWIGNPS